MLEEVNQSMQIESIVESVEIDEESQWWCIPLVKLWREWQGQDDKMVDLIDATREYD